MKTNDPNTRDKTKISNILNLLNKDVKEFNKIGLSLFCALFLAVISIFSYKIGNFSYAVFTNEIIGDKIIGLKVQFQSGKTFDYTGDVQTYEVPYDGYYYIELGGGGIEDVTYTGGAKTSGYIYLDKGTDLYFYVGGQGTKINTNCRTSGYEFNGGGIAKPAKAGICGATGGSATDVRMVGGSWDDTSSLISRIMVAGGAGGLVNFENSQYSSGAGGTLYGGDPLFATYQANLGNPGKQTSGGAAPTIDSCAQSTGTAGSFGKGGLGGANNATNAQGGGGSGGGSGYYGGSGASGLCNGTWPGAGGSSYISGYAGVNSVANNTTITHTNQTLHYSGKYFIGSSMVEGANIGNGYAKIKYVENKPKRVTKKLDNVRYIKNCVYKNTANAWNAWGEIQAIKDGVNIAKGKAVTGITAHPTEAGPITNITDGLIGNLTNSSVGGNVTASECVTVDLGDNYDLDQVAVWNYAESTRRYYSNLTSVSSNNSDWTLINDQLMYENTNGKRVDAYVNALNGYVRDKILLWYDGYANTGDTRSVTSTSWKDLAGNKANATLSGVTVQADSLYFDGTDDFVTLPSTGASYPSTYSLVYKTRSNASQIIFGDYSNNAALGIYNNSRFITGLVTSSATFETGGITPEKYYKVDIVYRTFSDKTVYVNGKKIAMLSSSDYFSWGDTNSYIGKRSTGTYFAGSIKNFIIYNKALSEDEIKHNYMFDNQRYNLD